MKGGEKRGKPTLLHTSPLYIPPIICLSLSAYPKHSMQINTFCKLPFIDRTDRFPPAPSSPTKNKKRSKGKKKRSDIQIE